MHMDKDTLLWAGAHRGAFTIAKELRLETLRLYAPTVILADPKGNRAAQLGEDLKKRFPTLTPQPLPLRVQDALFVRGDLDTVVLSLDTLGDTTTTLNAARPSQAVTFQICGKGPGGVGGTPIALQGTLCPGDHETQKSVSLLLPTLSEMSRAASSRELTGPDPVTAAVLQPLRHAVSRQTAAHLGEKGREPGDLSGGPLSLTFGQTLLPLIAVEGGSRDKYSQQTALALEKAGEFPVNTVMTSGLSGSQVVVAIVIPQALTVHFVRVAITRSDKRVVTGLSSFVTQSAASSESALFTD
jgi:hypothetical protein